MDARMLLDNFKVIAEAPGGVRRLRELILLLAIQGRLTKRPVKASAAKEVLELIRKETPEKMKRVLKKIRRSEDDWPHELPSAWVKTYIGEIIVDGPTNGYSPRAVSHETPVRSLTLSATTSGIFDARHVKFIDEDISPDSPLWLKPNDILVQRSNTIDYVGIGAVYTGKSDTHIYPDLMMRIRISLRIRPRFVHLAINCPPSRNFFRANASGTAGSMPKINQTTLCSLPIPLPSPEEQDQILSKVDALMSFCNDLEEKQQRQRELGVRFSEAAIRALSDRRQ